MYTTLISVQELTTAISARKKPDDLLIVDCRAELGNPAAGESAYRAGHIPEAVYASLDHDLAAPVTAATGRHPLPSPQDFAALLGRWGLTPQTQVVAYDADNGMFAARLWWLLRWAGHGSVAVLDGGLKAWLTEGCALSTATAQRDATSVSIKPRNELAVSSAQVAEFVQLADWRVLDARAPERFAGSVEPIDPVAGHVPGARNHPFATNMVDGRFLGASTLRQNFQTSQQGVASEQTIAMCGSGVTACHLLLAMEHAGLPGARLYPGSWSEWIRDPQRPVQQGAH